MQNLQFPTHSFPILPGNYFPILFGIYGLLLFDGANLVVNLQTNKKSDFYYCSVSL